jgi:hypothetical protein
MYIADSIVPWTVEWLALPPTVGKAVFCGLPFLKGFESAPFSSMA